MKRVLYFAIAIGFAFYAAGFLHLPPQYWPTAIFFGIGLCSMVAALCALYEVLVEAQARAQELEEVRVDAYEAMTRMLPYHVQQHPSVAALLHNLSVGARVREYGE